MLIKDNTYIIHASFHKAVRRGARDVLFGPHTLIQFLYARLKNGTYYVIALNGWAYAR